jgi:hypothetical protein
MLCITAQFVVLRVLRVQKWDENLMQTEITEGDELHGSGQKLHKRNIVEETKRFPSSESSPSFTAPEVKVKVGRVVRWG